MVFVRTRGECNLGTRGSRQPRPTPLQIEDAFQGLKCPSSILGQLASRVQAGAREGQKKSMGAVPNDENRLAS